MRGLPRISSGPAGLLALLVLVAFAASRCGGGSVPPARGPEVADETAAPEPAPDAEEAPAPEGAAGEARRLFPVIRITDGDTIHVHRRGDETIRLIGIDTPEVDWYGGEAECYGEEAGLFLRRLLDGTRVGLELDRDREDPYERTLAYVYLEDGRMVNVLLVRRGYAIVTIYEPNDRHEVRLRAAEADARAAGRGLWSAC